MIFLPDTNVWIRFLNPGENHVKNHFLSADPATIWLCSVVKAELFFGALKSARIKENLRLWMNCLQISILFFLTTMLLENTARSVRILLGRVLQLVRTI